MIATTITSRLTVRGLLLLAATVISSALISACSEQATDKPPTESTAPTQDMTATTQPTESKTTTGELKQEWAEAVETLKSYTVDQREQATANAEELLAAMDRRIAQMESNAKQDWQALSQEIRQQREATLQALKEERNGLAEWYNKMKTGSGDAWQEIKQGFIKAYASLSGSFINAQDEFDDDTEDRDAQTQP